MTCINFPSPFFYFCLKDPGTRRDECYGAFKERVDEQVLGARRRHPHLYTQEHRDCQTLLPRREARQSKLAHLWFLPPSLGVNVLVITATPYAEAELFLTILILYPIDNWTDGSDVPREG